MTTAVYLGNNLIGTPAERKPSMHELFYRVEACGTITVIPKWDYYRVYLERPKDKYTMVEIRKDFYDCLLYLYRRLEKEIKHESTKSND